MSIQQSGEIIGKLILHNDALVTHLGQQEDHLKEIHHLKMTDLQKDIGHHPVHLQILLIEEVVKEEELMQGEEGHHHLLAHPLHQVLLIRTGSEEGEHARRTNGRRVRPQRAWKRAQKFKEGGKNVTFLTYDGSYGQVDKVLNFVQQFDAAFGGENFTESSKLRHMSMYLQKSARKWWASLKTKGIQPRSWKRCRLELMKQFLPGNVKDDVLTAWRGLTYKKGDNIQKYVDKFWDLHLKASVFKDIDFDEQRQQFCAGLPEDV